MKTFWSVLGCLAASFSLAQTENPGQYHWHHEVVDFAEQLAAHHDRVELKEYGVTPEGRPLQVLVFGLPEHLQNLAAIQANQMARAKGEPTDARYDDLAVVWLSYDVHGNEASCTEAALEVMAELADDNSARAQKWLERLVVLVDPCLNPDGHDRYVHFVDMRSAVPANADPGHWSHSEPWPGGRLNHYLFDLNRDWAWARQPETQARIALYGQWLPHVHGDYHEMGFDSPYYFAPAVKPYHELITPWQREFQTLVGNAAAMAFDGRNERYFTREDFDLFYPSYGDTYPIFRGAIGMTYEQGGGPRSGRVVERENGLPLTLNQRIANHVASSYALLEVCWEQADRLIAEANAYFNQSRSGAAGAYAAYVFPNDQVEIDRLLPFLDQHGIQYGHADASKKAVAGYTYSSGQNRPITWDESDWIVPCNQTQGALLQVLMDPNPHLEDSLTYDITAWSLPYCYGLECYGLTEVPKNLKFSTYASATAGDVEPAYAYAIAPKTAAERSFVARAMAAGLGARLLTKSAQFQETMLPAGTVTFQQADQPDVELSQALNALNTDHVALISLESGHAQVGVDLGSDAAIWMPFPKVAILGGDQVRALSLGEIWWHLETELQIQTTVLDANRLPDLSKYDVIVLPDGVQSPSSDALEAFAKAGGTVIAIGDAMRLVSKWESTRLERAAKGSDQNDDPLAVPYAERNRDQATRSIEGAIFSLRIDPSHPIGYLESDLGFALKQGTDSWEPLESGQNVAVYASDTPISGHAGHATRSLALKDQLALGVEYVGEGKVVYFVDNPLFRGFWEEGKAYFDRALLFSAAY